MRDKDIQRVFEIADDSLQGILGHYLYVLALQSTSNVDKVLESLPQDKFQMTFSWDRYYDKRDLVQAFTNKPIFEIYQARASLTSIVTVFNVALNGFIEHLRTKGHKQKIGDTNFENCIKWAYEQLSPCDIGDTEAIKRLPVTFGILDNARRLRNLIIHNQGLFDDSYEKQVIHFKDIAVEIHPNYSFYKANPQKSTPVIIDTGYFLRFSKAHLEVLHLLHNSIQKKYFGCQKAYDYLTEGKIIKWDTALWGSANVKIQFTDKSLEK